MCCWATATVPSRPGLAPSAARTASGAWPPGPGGNFVKGTKEFDALFEFQYKQSLSVNFGYNWYWGGGAYNVLSDRDFAQFFIKYQF